MELLATSGAPASRGSRAAIEAIEPRLLLSAQLVADINQTSPGSDPQQLVRLGDVVYFVASSASGPQRFWRTDGTSGGTTVISSTVVPTNLTAANGKLFFGANLSDGSGNSLGREPWVSDGTAAGSVPLKDIYALGAASSEPREFTAFNGETYFVARDGTHGHALWKTDGTTAGTVLVKDIHPASHGSEPAPQRLIAAGNWLYFTADDGVHGREVWRSDGTAAGTQMLVDTAPGPDSSNPDELLAIGDEIFFEGYTGTTAGWIDVFRSDGTTTTTAINHPGNTDHRFYTAVGTDLYFVQNERSLYKFDTSAGGAPQLMREYNPFNNGYEPPSRLTNVNGTLYFSAHEFGTGAEPWTTDGTPGGTHLVYDTRPAHGSGVVSGSQFFAVGDTLFFTAVSGAKSELWKHNAQGTSVVTNFQPDSSFPLPPAAPKAFCAFGSSLLFSADDGFHGPELWISDATPPGTHMLKDLLPETRGSNPNTFVAVGGTMLFRASDNFQDGLYRTDGTAGGTSRIAVINQAARLAYHGAVSRGVYYFYNGDATSGIEPWRTDGTPGGTYRLKDVYPGDGSALFTQMLSTGNGFVDVNGTLFFLALHPSYGMELWKSDGTEPGTVLVRDITPGVDSTFDSSYYPNLTHVDGTLFFAARGPSGGGVELWKSDGTEQGTVLVKDINPAGNSSPQQLTSFNGALYFWAEDAAGAELWKSDGTAQGTVRFDLFPGPNGSGPMWFTPAGDHLFFAAQSSFALGRGLWKTDGTPGGTVRVGGPYDASPSHLVNVGGTIYFNNNSGGYVVRSDGTAAGTVRAWAADPALPGPMELPYAANGRLYFGGGVPGATRLWVSDPTDPPGTAPAVALVSGLTRAHPFLATGGRLYFAATDAAFGLELRALDAPFARLGADRVLRLSGDAGGADVRLERVGPDVVVTLAGRSLSFDASGIDAVVFNGTGGAARLDMRSGTHVFNTDAGASGGRLTVDVAGGARVVFNAGQRLAGLHLGAGAVATMPPDGGRALFTRNLAISSSATLDLSDNDLIWDYSGVSPYAASKGYVVAGRNTGTGGIVTLATPADDTTLAVVDNAQFGRTVWNGEPIDGTTIIGKYTFFGDANLDGKVTGDDYLAVDANLGLTGAQWFQGDFNFDGKTTGDDYLAIDANLGQGTTAPLSYTEEQAEMIALHAELYGGKSYVKAVEAAAGVKYKPRAKPRIGA